MILVGLLVGSWESIMNRYDRWRRPPQPTGTLSLAESEFFCPMHPSVVRGEAASCPICGMPLGKRTKSEVRHLPDGVLAQVQLTPFRVQLGRIATQPVGYRLLAREIRTVGMVGFDETRQASLAARIRGRVDRLMANYVGQPVKKGEPLAMIYSPELLTTQEGLLSAHRRLQELRKAQTADLETQESLVRNARRRLELWGVTTEQIDDILQRNATLTHLPLVSPMTGVVTKKQALEGQYVMDDNALYEIADLSRVWVQVQVFEDQLGGVERGTAVELTTNAYPGERFVGRIASLADTVDPRTHTVAARVEMDNPDFKLKPGMMAAAVIRIPVGKVGEIPTPSVKEPVVDSGEWVSSYLAVTQAFSRDSLDAGALARLRKASRSLIERVPNEARAKLAELADRIDKLDGMGLEQQRIALKTISKDGIEIVRAFPPAGKVLYVVHCPMVEADWLQDEKRIANPYYGSAMLICGEIKSTIPGQSATDHERFAEGYFCPLMPEQVFDEAPVCPVNPSPLKRVRVEKSLAVPASAVIKSGLRTVVYRESTPGLFEMIEVRLGTRAGEFYPVLSGLQSGEPVATAGAFLVDAENRLNPNVAAQYFGTTGGPQDAN